MLNPGTYQGTYEAENGVLCLDFANTMSWRGNERAHEWLDNYTNLVAWSELVGIFSHEQSEGIKERVAQYPQNTSKVLQRAINLREAIYRILSAHISGKSVNPSDLEVLNTELQGAHQHARIAMTNTGFVRQWIDDPPAPERILWLVAESMAKLLTSQELERVGECQGDGCGWLFLDISKNHSRRWCSMNDCGNRAKVRAHYQRKRRMNKIEQAPALMLDIS